MANPGEGEKKTSLEKYLVELFFKFLCALQTRTSLTNGCDIHTFWPYYFSILLDTQIHYWIRTKKNRKRLQDMTVK